MPRLLMFLIYFLMISIGLVAMYTLLNAGSPDSLLRRWLPDPASDVYLAAASSFIVFVLGFFVFYNRDHAGFQELIRVNQERIRDLRRKGSSDGEIAESILAAMGSTRGYRHNMARKKLMAHLAKFQ